MPAEKLSAPTVDAERLWDELIAVINGPHGLGGDKPVGVLINAAMLLMLTLILADNPSDHEAATRICRVFRDMTRLAGMESSSKITRVNPGPDGRPVTRETH